MRWEFLVGAGVVAAAILFVGRWEVSAVPGSGIVAYRLDRWSGVIDYCGTGDEPPQPLASDPIAQADQREWRIQRELETRGALVVRCHRPKAR